MRRGFSLVELLFAVAVGAILAALLVAIMPQLTARADSAEALGKIRRMGSAVLNYPADHNGFLPPLFPGQVLEYEAGRGGRIVTECAGYLGIEPVSGKFLVTALMPRVYARLAEPQNKNTMRVYVMNSALTNGEAVLYPFGRVGAPGKPPAGNTTLALLAGAGSSWMMSTADQLQRNVAGAPWKNNTPKEPPLVDKRAVFRFDGAGELREIDAP